MTLDAQLEPSKDYRLLVFDTFYLAINTSICTPVHQRKFEKPNRKIEISTRAKRQVNLTRRDQFQYGQP